VLARPEAAKRETAFADTTGLVSHDETMEELGLSKRQLDRLVALGKLVPRRRGRQIYFTADSVDSVRTEKEELTVLMGEEAAVQEIFQSEADDEIWFDSRLIAPGEGSGVESGGEEESHGEVSPPDGTGVLSASEEAPPGQLREEDACRVLNVSPRRLRLLVGAGLLRPIRSGEERRYAVEEVEDLSQRFDEVVAGLPARLRLRLRVVEGEAMESRRVVVDRWALGGDREWVIGRLPAVDIPLLDDTFLSQRHAAIRCPLPGRRGEGRRPVLEIRDLGSQNGTWVGDEPCTPEEWYDVPLGGRIRLGGTTFVVEPAPEEEGAGDAGPEDGDDPSADRGTETRSFPVDESTSELPAGPKTGGDVPPKGGPEGESPGADESEGEGPSEAADEG
jgi:pSer/pThr/pTyr-binding forkhead associated (FHA) protein